MVSFCDKGSLYPRPIPTLHDRLVGRQKLLLTLEGVSLIRNLKTRHVVVTRDPPKMEPSIYCTIVINVSYMAGSSIQIRAKRNILNNAEMPASSALSVANGLDRFGFETLHRNTCLCSYCHSSSHRRIHSLILDVALNCNPPPPPP